MFTNTVFGLILAYVFMALWDEKPHLGGCGRPRRWPGAAGAAHGDGDDGRRLAEDELIERIRTGDIEIDLYRPADLQLWWLSQDAGAGHVPSAGARSGAPRVRRAVLRTGAPRRPADLDRVPDRGRAGTVVSFSLRYLVALSAFWLLDGAGVAQMSMIAVCCSGMLLPLNVFPGALGEVVRALPWSSLVQGPAGSVLLGTADPLGTYVFQASWALGLLALGRLIQSVATRRVVVQGG